MGKEIITGINGGMPFTQQTLKYLQDAGLDILKLFYSHLNISNIGKYILGGCVQTGNTITEGWLLIDGELLYIAAGTGTYVEIKTNETLKTYQDLSNNINYVEKYAEMTNSSSGNFLFTTFQRLSQHKTITHSDCTHLANRTYQYNLSKHITTLELSPLGNTTSGFILNRINPFEGITNGYQLLVKCGTGSGLTFLTKNSVVSNLRFNEKEFSALGDNILAPYFGLSHFIGAGAGVSNAGYAPGLHVLFSWSSALNVWIEISRTSNLSL